MIKGISFDLDGVIVFSDLNGLVKETSKSYGLSKEKVLEAFVYGDWIKAYKEGRFTTKQFFRKIKEKYGVFLTSQKARQRLADYYRIDRRMLNLVDKLRENYKVAILSNNYPVRVEALEEKFKFLKHFDETIFSYEVKLAKPNLKILEVVLGKLKIKKDELLVVDDSQDFVGKANKASYKAYFYHGLAEFKQELKRLRLI